jgi:hypothetical protein
MCGILPLLAVGGTLCSGGRPLVAGVAGDTHDCDLESALCKSE